MPSRTPLRRAGRGLAARSAHKTGGPHGPAQRPLIAAALPLLPAAWLPSPPAPLLLLLLPALPGNRLFLSCSPSPSPEPVSPRIERVLLGSPPALGPNSLGPGGKRQCPSYSQAPCSEPGSPRIGRVLPGNPPALGSRTPAPGGSR